MSPEMLWDRLIIVGRLREDGREEVSWSDTRHREEAWANRCQKKLRVG